MLEKIPDFYGEGKKLQENREALVKIFHLLRKSHQALTIVDTHGKNKMLFEAIHNHELGVVSWLIFNNFKNTGETLVVYQEFFDSHFGKKWCTSAWSEHIT